MLLFLPINDVEDDGGIDWLFDSPERVFFLLGINSPICSRGDNGNVSKMADFSE